MPARQSSTQTNLTLQVRKDWIRPIRASSAEEGAANVTDFGDSKS